MKAFLQKAWGILTHWIGNGPWRSKSVLVAFVVAVAGLGFWFSSIQNTSPPRGPSRTAINSPAITSSEPATVPAPGHWNWGKPFPGYVRLTVSYVAGFFIGWFSRKLIRMILIVTTLAIALLAFGKLAGCDTTTRTQEQVKRGGERLQQDVTAAKDYLQQLLPSVGAGGIGIFLGFRRRSRTATSQPAGCPTPDPSGPE